MKTKTQFLVALSILIIGVTTSCEKENEILAKAEIHGEVEFNDIPYQGATVNLHTGTIASDPFAGFDNQALTGEDGKFDFDNLSKGEYYIFAFLLDGHDTLSRDKIIIVTTDKGTYEADIHIESENHED